MKIKNLIFLLLFAIAGNIFTVSGAVSVSGRGYTATAVITGNGSNRGVVLQKGKIFKLESSGKLYTFYVFDNKGNCAIKLESDIPAGKHAVAIQFERVHEQAQGQDGYRAILNINGKRTADYERTPLALPSAASDLTIGKNFKGKVSAVKEHSRLMTDGEIRQACGINPSDLWQKSVSDQYLENSELIMGIKSGSGTGNPLLGVYDKKAGQLLIPAGGIDWELQYRDSNGIFRYINSSAFKYSPVKITSEGSRHTVDIVWHNDMFQVKNSWKMENGRIESAMSVKILKNGTILEKISFPALRVKKLASKNFALIPKFSGIVVPDPTVNMFYRAPYPGGNASMQLTALYNDLGTGVYLSREDASGSVKELAFSGGGGFYDAVWSVAVPRGINEITLPGKGAVERYNGSWFEAGQIYKKFVRTAPWWIDEIPRKDTPEWFMNMPLWLVGFDINSIGTVSALENMKNFYEVPFALETGLLCNLKGKWRFGPDFKYKDGFLNHLDKIHALGIPVGPYYNSRLCYAGESAEIENNYSTTGKLYAVKDEAGRERQENYGRIGMHSVMCPACSKWQKQLYDNVERLAAGKVKFIYHDQLPCGRGFPCFDSSHDHLVNDPEGWLKKGHWITYNRIMTELRKKYPELAHTGEDASETYLRCLDGFMCWRFGMPGHVPLFQSIYAPRIQFVGRGGDSHSVSGTYESFFPKFGEQLVFNEQIGWLSVQDVPYPSPRRNYIKKLAHLRMAAVNFLNSSEMLAPLKFRTAPATLSCRWGVAALEDVTTDKILHAVWQHTDGRKMIIFLNTVDEKQSVEPLIAFGFKNVTILRENGSTVERLSGKSPEKVELLPYGVEFWIFDTAEKDKDVDSLASMLKKTSGIMQGSRGPLIQQRQDFTKCEMRDAVKEPMYARYAQWMLFAYRATGKGLNHDPGSRYKPLTYNWIAAQDGAVISYGLPFIGKHPDYLEIELATDQKGVTVQFCDIGHDRTDTVIAEIKPTPGKWFEFKKYRVKWRNTYERPQIVIRVKGGSCNIGAWQSFDKKITVNQ